MADGLIQHLFRDAAERFSDRPAIAGPRGPITYAALDAGSSRLANALRDLGLPKGSTAGLLTEDPYQLIPGILGVLKARGAFVPLDPVLPVNRLRTLVSQAEIRWLLCDPASRDLAEALAAGGAPGTRILLLDGEEVRAASPTAPPLDAEPDDFCYVFFTSGSIGKPKGIAGRLKAIDHFVRWEIWTLGLGQGVRVSQLTAPSFDAILRDLFVPLSAGGTVCLPESREAAMDGGRLVRWLDREGVNVVHCVPSLFRALVNEPLTPDLFPELRHVLLSGEPLLPADVRRWMATFGDRVNLVNLYGPSETTMVKLFYPVRPEDADRAFIPIGKPMEGARAVVVDEAGEVCPPGMAGEIWIRTPYRSLGYYNQPELTRESFIPNPFSDRPNDLVYKTGDLGRILEDGNFEFLGRRDSQVKIRGVRVELGEIESLLRGHEQVLDVAVVDREDSRGTRVLCAYLVTRDAVDSGALRAWLGQHLSEALIPSTFVRLDALPRTATGKVDRRALPTPAELLAVAHVPPRTPIEEVLAAIWMQILDAPRVGIHDSFFDLGGHSLLATQLLSRIRTSFDVDLSLRAVFDGQTIARIAAVIEDAVRERRHVASPPIVPVSRGELLPLSFAQQRLWLLDQLHPGSPAYNLASVFRMRGPLNVRALTASLGEIVARHEALRTVFRVRSGEPAQVILPPGSLSIARVDLRSLPDEAREAEARRLAAEEVQRPFDLERGPLVRPQLLWLGAEDHVALFTVHHIVSDDWSMGLLVRELIVLYRDLSLGKPSTLPPLPLQYADFAHWQRRWLTGEVLAAQLTYWREKLAGAPPVLQLPMDRPRPAVQSFRGTRRVVTLPAELAESLRRVSRGGEATLFMTLLAAFDAFLSRLTGQDDLVVGSPVANRNRADLEGILGFFVNTLVLRADLSGDPTAADLLARVRETALDAYVHQDLPFEKLVEELQPSRDLARSPLFQVLFVLQNAPAAFLELPEIRLEPVDVPRETARLDLAVSLAEAPQGLWGLLEYSTDLFDEATILRFWRHFETLLEGFAATPERRISELPLLTEEESRQLLAWNDTAAEEPNPSRVHELFERRAAALPEAVAVAFEDRRVTYAELDRRANQLARYLQRLGVGPETPVGLGLERTPEAIVGLLGILKAGGFYVPLDPEYPAERLRAMLYDAGATVLVTEERFASLAPDPATRRVLLDADLGRIEAEDPAAPDVAVDGANPAYVIYTSGSLGRPKGVVVPHRALANFSHALASAIGLGPGERILEFASLSFDASALQIFPALLSGATLVLDRHPGRLSAAEVLELCERQEVTVLDLPAAVWRQWIDAMAGREARLPARIRTFLTGGESLPVDKLRSWARLPAPGARLFSSYGPTEATVTTTLFGIASDAAQELALAKVPLGDPLPNTRVHLLDVHRRPVPAGVPGEIYIGGAGLARGYLGRPELTAEAFVPSPESREPGERLYRTGDLARRLPGGSLEFLGRLDHQVKIRGVRVEPGEVQAALGQHPAVRQCVVTAREEPSGDRRLTAYLVAAEPVPGVAELRGFLAGRLPEPMIPSSFTLLPELPLLPSGKVDLRALPAPSLERPDLGRTFVAPGNAVEEVLASLFREVLGVDQVGVHDDFFALGGHSLLAAQVIGRARDLLQAEIQLRQLFEAPTVAGLTALLLAEDAERQRLLEIAEILVTVDRLSSEEVEAMLAQDASAPTESELA